MCAARWLLALVLASPLAHAQPPAPLPPLTPAQLSAIDAFVSAELARQRIPGLELGIYSRGHILLAKGYGQANVELAVPVKPETLFQSGSVGKQFVSAAVLMLVEEGKLSLSDSLAQYFSGAPDSWKPIKIGNLLSHTSGLAEYESDDRTGPAGPFYLRLDYTEDELAKKFQALPIEAAPGEKWAYRNTNYVLLGIIIHKLTGQFYGDFLAQRIFRPLGMASTRIISEADIIPNRSSGYELHDGVLKNQTWVSPTFDSTADGALYFNVLDIARWDAALYTTQLLKQSSLDRIWTVYPLNNGKPNPEGYGFAWFIGQQNKHRRIEHSGSWQGYTCHIARYPDDSLSVAVLTNLDSGHSDPGLIAHVVAGLVQSALLPAKLAAIADNDPAIAARVAHVLDQTVAGEDLRPQAAAQLASYLTPEAMGYARQRFTALWPGGTLTLVQREPSEGSQPISTFRLAKGNEAVLITFGLDAAGKIATLRLAPNREYQ